MVSLAWDTAVLDMSFRVQIEKLLLILHIRSMQEDTLAKKIYMEQKKLNLPGLAKETTLICQSLNIEDCNTT